MNDSFDERRLLDEAWKELSTAQTVMSAIQGAEQIAAFHLTLAWSRIAARRKSERSLQSGFPLNLISLPKLSEEEWAKRRRELSELVSGYPNHSPVDAVGAKCVASHIVLLTDELIALGRSEAGLKSRYKALLLAVLLIAVLSAALAWLPSGLESRFSRRRSSEEQALSRPRHWNGFSVSVQQQGWGDLHLNASVEGNPLTVAGVRYERGLGTHAYSSIVLSWPAARNAQTLTGKCGVDDETNGKGSIRCRISDGNKVIYESQPLSGGDGAASFTVPVSGLSSVVLEVDPFDESPDHDHADWIDLTLDVQRGH